MSIAKRMRLVDENYVEMIKRIGKSARADDTQALSDTEATKERIIKNLPKTYALKGAALIDFLLSKGIGFNEENSLVIKGEKVMGTNFEDLVHDLLRPRDRPPPPGFDQLAMALSTANVSRELITNLERYQAIAKQRISGEVDDGEKESLSPHEQSKHVAATRGTGYGERRRGAPKDRKTKQREWISW